MTPSRTPFLGLEYLEAADPLSSDGYKFQGPDRLIIDRAARVGCVTHRHDAHVAMANPVLALALASAAAGGTIPGDASLFVTYTLVDPDGGETLPVLPAQTITTSPGFANPFDVPAVVVDYAGGTLLAGNYSYGATVTDGLGGETTISPVAAVTVDPGNANAEATISGLTVLTDDASSSAPGAGWRLWRSQGGGPWYLIGTGPAATDGLIDNGIAGDCSVAPPPTGSTGGANTLQVTVPGGQPAEAVSINIYGSLDGSFVSPSLLGNYPVPGGGAALVVNYASLLPVDGAPPSVSTCFPGANLIDPSDILGLSIKAPVANAPALPLVGNADGDVRVALDTHHLWVWDAINGWKRDAWWPPATNEGTLPNVGLLDGDLCLTLDTHVIWCYSSAATAWHTLGRARESAVTNIAGLVAATETAETINMVGPAMEVFAVTVTAACRIRLYPTAALAAVDRARAASSDPDTAAQNGCYYEHTFGGGGTHILTPAALAVMQEVVIVPTIAANISSPGGGAVTVTLRGYRVE